MANRPTPLDPKEGVSQAPHESSKRQRDQSLSRMWLLVLVSSVLWWLAVSWLGPVFLMHPSPGPACVPVSPS